MSKSPYPEELVTLVLRYCNKSKTTFKAQYLAKVFGCTKRTIYSKVAKVKKTDNIMPSKAQKLSSDEVFSGLLQYSQIAGFKLNPTLVGAVCGFTKRTTQIKLAHARELHEAAASYYANEETEDNDEDGDDDDDDMMDTDATTALTQKQAITPAPKVPEILKPAANKPKAEAIVKSKSNGTIKIQPKSVEETSLGQEHSSPEIKREDLEETTFEQATAAMHIRKPTPAALDIGTDTPAVPQHLQQWIQSGDLSGNTSFSRGDGIGPILFDINSIRAPFDTNTSATTPQNLQQWTESGYSSRCNTSFPSDDGLAPFHDANSTPAAPQIFPHDLRYPALTPILRFGPYHGGNYLPSPDSALLGLSQFPTFGVLYDEALASANNTYDHYLYDLAVGAAQHGPTWATEPDSGFAPLGYRVQSTRCGQGGYSLSGGQDYAMAMSMDMGMAEGMGVGMEIPMYHAANYTANHTTMNDGLGQSMPVEAFYYPPTLMTPPDTKLTQEEMDAMMNY